SEQLVSAMFHTPAGPAPDSAAMSALTAIMTVAPAGRLYKALVETHKASSVDSYFFQLRDPGMVLFESQLPVGDPPAPLREALIATLTGVKEAPVTEAELNRVRAKEVKEFNDTINDPQKFGVRISESIAQGDWRLMFIERDRWKALTPADVTRVATNYFKRSDMTIGEFIPDAKPDRAPLEAPVDVQALVKDYKGDAAIAAGE